MVSLSGILLFNTYQVFEYEYVVSVEYEDCVRISVKEDDTRNFQVYSRGELSLVFGRIVHLIDRSQVLVFLYRQIAKTILAIFKPLRTLG